MSLTYLGVKVLDDVEKQPSVRKNKSLPGSPQPEQQEGLLREAEAWSHSAWVTGEAGVHRGLISRRAGSPRSACLGGATGGRFQFDKMKN